jgi:hypothetical protein
VRQIRESEPLGKPYCEAVRRKTAAGRRSREISRTSIFFGTQKPSFNRLSLRMATFQTVESEIEEDLDAGQGVGRLQHRGTYATARRKIFATVTLPLTALLAKGPWRWTKETDRAFREVKVLFAGLLTLYRLDLDRDGGRALSRRRPRGMENHLLHRITEMLGGGVGG